MPASPRARLYYRAARQRFEDAEFLPSVDRTAAAVYVSGYGVECMLKALILAAVPRAREEEVGAELRGSRAHEFGWKLRLYAERGGPRVPADLVSHVARVITWSTDLRYSPGTIQWRDAKAFLRSAAIIYRWAEARLS